MASLSKSSSGLFQIQFKGKDGRRRSIRLGRVTKKHAEEVKHRVEYLVNATTGGMPIDPVTVQWLSGIGNNLAAKLAAVGLIPRRTRSAFISLHDFIDQYIADKPKAPPNSVKNYRQAQKKLTAHFGRERSITSITTEDCAAWVKALEDHPYADATIARLIKFGKQFFNHAIKKKIVSESPFAGIAAGSMENRDRIFFVSEATTQAILAACPTQRWRSIVALLRYGGLRCPSELGALRWVDIDWMTSRMLIRSSKTGRDRTIPMFPEIRAELEKLRAETPASHSHVIELTDRAGQNLRRYFGLIILRSGVDPWPRVFQNLRASRENELMAIFPWHVVAEWMGHSPSVSAKHYLRVQEADFVKAVQKAVHATTAMARNETQGLTSPNQESPSFVNACVISANACGQTEWTGLHPTGGEQIVFHKGFRGLPLAGGVKSGAFDELLDIVMHAWSSLKSSEKESIVRIVIKSSRAKARKKPTDIASGVEIG